MPRVRLRGSERIHQKDSVCLETLVLNQQLCFILLILDKDVQFQDVDDRILVIVILIGRPPRQWIYKVLKDYLDSKLENCQHGASIRKVQKISLQKLHSANLQRSFSHHHRLQQPQ